ncbi:stress transcription factor A [Seminavis robusta]|uniref:Stress transcription factor A n=1 Tax=Seminavis robusta TaxID=568900 RepID=A0A9N8E6X7_9STRA|nr:stress transcription factor A [Seminavis robusta]|eukprot:Sro687_g187270.1 stress transcription factor A (518) ;mRNA; r:33912-36167
MMETTNKKSQAEDGAEELNAGNDAANVDQQQAASGVDEGNFSALLPVDEATLEGTGGDSEAEGKEADPVAASVGDSSAAASDPTRFPFKLHRMLSEIETGSLGMEGIVSWQPHGRCFMIRDKKAFTDTVMPKYFYQLKYVSFQRQLNLYGFKKIYGQGPDKGAYYHELFLRGKSEVAGSIQRVKPAKGSDRTKGKSEEPEINFYALPPLDDKAIFCLEEREKMLLEEKASPKSKSKGSKRRKSRASLKSTGSGNSPAQQETKEESSSAGLVEPTPLRGVAVSAGESLGALSAHAGGSLPPMEANLANSASLSSTFPNPSGHGLGSQQPFDIQHVQQLPPHAQSLMRQHMGSNMPTTGNSNQASSVAAAAGANPFGMMNHPLFGNLQQQQEQGAIQSLQSAQEQMAALLGGGDNSHAAAHQLSDLEPTPIKPGMQQLLPSMSATEQSSNFFQQQQRILHQLQNQSGLSGVPQRLEQQQPQPGQQQGQNQDAQTDLQFPSPQGGGGEGGPNANNNSWMG